jgi:hypothetical protein
MSTKTILSNESKQAIAEANADAEEAINEAAFTAEIEDGTDDFDTTVLAAPLVLPASLAKDSAPKNARNEAQLAIDSVVADVHAKWLEAGEPRVWPDIVSSGSVAGYWVNPASEVRIKKMIKSGADFKRLAVRFGQVAPRAADMPQDGRVFISFTILTRRSRSTS